MDVPLRHSVFPSLNLVWSVVDVEYRPVLDCIEEEKENWIVNSRRNSSVSNRIIKMSHSSSNNVVTHGDDCASPPLSLSQLISPSLSYVDS